MYRSPDQNSIPKIYHLCLPCLCTTTMCLWVRFKPVCLLFSCLSVIPGFDIDLKHTPIIATAFKSWSNLNYFWSGDLYICPSFCSFSFSRSIYDVLLCWNWNFLWQQMKEVNTFENLSWEMCVLETTAQCVRDKMD